MSFRTNALKVQAFAGAVYGIQVGTTTMAQINADITSAGGLANALNGYYASSFGSVANATVATTIATNLGLTGDALTSGAAYITAQLNAAAADARGAVISNILDLFAGLASDATFGAFATAYNTKVDTAVAYTGTANVAIGTVVAASGTTFTLTTGVDNGAAFTGTAGNDIYSADLSTAGANTLNTLDSINGGAGSDTLTAVLAADAAPAALVSIENVVAVGSGGAARALNLVNAADVESVTVSGSTAGSVVTVNNIAAGADLAVSSQAVAATFNYTTVTGTADSANLSVSGVTGAAAITVNGIESIAVTSSGSANTYQLSADSANAVSFAGSANQTVTLAGMTAVSHFDASAATGAVNLTVTNQSSLLATTDLTVTGGEGNDTITVTAHTQSDISVDGGAGNDTIVNTAIVVADTIVGGDGTDTLSTNNAQANVLDATETSNISSIEALTISDAFDGTLVVANVASGIATVNLASTAAGAGALMAGGDQVTGGAGTFAVNLGGSAAGNVTTMGGALTVADTGTAGTDTVTITNAAKNSTTGASLDVFNAQDLTSTGYENVVLSTGSGTGNVENTIGTLTITPDTITDNVSLTVTGGNALDIATSLTTTSTGLMTVDASGMTAQAAGTTTFDIAATAQGTGGTASIIGSAGEDIIAVGNFASTIIGGEGNDALTGGTAADNIQGGDGVDVIIGGGGNDTVTGGAGNDDITVSGTSVNVDAGEGDDVVNMDGTLSSGDVVVGGDGTDTLAIDAAATAESSQGVSGFERLRFDTTGLNQDMVQFTANSTFTRLDYNVAGSNAVTNASATTNEIRALNGTVLAQFDRLLDNSSNALTVGALTDVATTITTLTVDDEETLTIGDGAIDSALTLTVTTLNADDLVTLNLTGVSNKVITNAIAGANDTLATINAASNTGTVTLTAASSTVAINATGSATAANVITTGSGADIITGGSAADSLTGGANADTISGGSGGDTILGGTGADSLTGGEGTDSITGGAGNDAINLTENTAATDRVVYESTAAGNGVDTITGFKAGALANGGDILNFDAFATNITAVNAITADAVTDIDGDVTILVDIVDGQDLSTAAGVTAAVAAGGEYASVTSAAGGATSIIITFASTTSHVGSVFYATSAAGADGAITATLVGTVDLGTGVYSDLVVANF